MASIGAELRSSYKLRSTSRSTWASTAGTRTCGRKPVKCTRPPNRCARRCSARRSGPSAPAGCPPTAERTPAAARRHPSAAPAAPGRPPAAGAGRETGRPVPEHLCRRHDVGPGRARAFGPRCPSWASCSVNIVCEVLEGAGPNGVPGSGSRGGKAERPDNWAAERRPPGTLIRAMPRRQTTP
jgi:hypothetical protein